MLFWFFLGIATISYCVGILMDKIWVLDDPQNDTDLMIRDIYRWCVVIFAISMFITICIGMFNIGYYYALNHCH